MMREISRIYIHRWRLAFILACFVINGIYFWYTQDVEEGQQYYDVYQEYIREHEDVPLEQLQKELNEQQQDEMIEDLIMSSDGEDNSKAFTQIFVKEEMKSTVEYLAGYKSRYDEMKANAEKMKKFAIFRESSSVSFQNIEQEIKDFKEASEVKVTLTQDKAIRAWEQADLPNYLLILMQIIIVIAFFEERNKGLSGMVRASAGRNKLVWTRIGILAITSVVGTMILSVTNLLLAVGIYGAPNWSNALQCLPDYGECPYIITIRQYVCISICHKILCIFGIACFFWLVMMLISKTMGAIIVMAIVLCVQYVIYGNMGDLHPYAILKYANVFSFLQVQQALQNYLNVQFAGELIEIWNVHRIALPILTIGLVILCAWAGCRLRGPVVKNIKILPYKLISKVELRFGQPSLLGQEGFKYLRIQGSILLLVGLAVYLYMGFSAKEVLYDETQAYVREYYQILDGELTREKEQYINQELKDVKKRLKELKVAYELGEDEHIVENYFQIREKIQTQKEAIKEIKTECKRLKKLQKDGVKACFVEPYGYQAMFELSSLNHNGQLLIFILVLPLLSAGIFAYENQSHAKRTLVASPIGYKKVCQIKYIWAFVGTVALWLICCVRELAQAKIMYNYPGKDEAIQNIALFGACDLHISIRTGVILLYVGRLFIMCLMTAVTIWISKKCSHMRTSYIISVVVLVMPAAFVVVGADYLEKISVLNLLRFGDYLIRWLNWV